MRLYKDKVVIRDFLKSDIPNKVRWINDPENNKFLHYNIPLEIKKTEHWFDTKDNQTRSDCIIEYSGIPVGLVGLLNIDRTNQKAEFYISMGETEYKRRGIAMCAVRLILEYAFNSLKLHKVYLNVDAENIAACRLYEKCGFTCEGEFTDDLFVCNCFISRKRYAVIRSDCV